MPTQRYPEVLSPSDSKNAPEHLVVPSRRRCSKYSPRNSPSRSSHDRDSKEQRRMRSSLSPSKGRKGRSGHSRQHGSDGRRSRHRHHQDAYRKKKTVAFPEDIRELEAIEYVMSLDEYSDDEYYSTWYDRKEYQQMQEECEDTADNFMEHDLPLPEGHCARGLECWTIRGEKAKEQLVMAAIDFVWSLQLKYYKDKNTDKVSFSEVQRQIAEAYSLVSRPCQESARAAAAIDERDVRSYLASAKSIEKARRRMVRAHEKANRMHARRSRSRSLDARPRGDNASSTGSRYRKGEIGRTGTHHGGRSPRSGHSGTRKTRRDDERRRRKEEDDYIVYVEEKKCEEVEEVPPPPSPASSPAPAETAPPVSAIPAAYFGAPTVARRKIVYEPTESKALRSRYQMPLSPCASISSDGSNSSRRRLSSRFSVCSDDSSRRRMLKQASIAHIN